MIVIWLFLFFCITARQSSHARSNGRGEFVFLCEQTNEYSDQEYDRTNRSFALAAIFGAIFVSLG